MKTQRLDSAWVLSLLADIADEILDDRTKDPVHHHGAAGGRRSSRARPRPRRAPVRRDGAAGLQALRQLGRDRLLQERQLRQQHHARDRVRLRAPDGRRCGLTFGDCVECPEAALAAMPCECPPTAQYRCGSGWIRCNARYRAWCRWQDSSLLGRVAQRSTPARAWSCQNPRTDHTVKVWSCDHWRERRAASEKLPPSNDGTCTAMEAC